MLHGPGSRFSGIRAFARMPHDLLWNDVALRLLLTVFAGAIVGSNRGHHGRAAGLRTTILVCLAASLSMIEANALLITHGKNASEYANMDVLRLPLGILSGMGFIGAGAIVRQGSLVTGLTTAATLWFITVLGLCFGGGQLLLGLVSLGIGMSVLWGLKVVERRSKREQRGMLTLVADKAGPEDRSIRPLINQSGFAVVAFGVAFGTSSQSRTLSYQLRWSAPRFETDEPAFITQLASLPGVRSLDWKPQTIEFGSEMTAD